MGRATAVLNKLFYDRDGVLRSGYAIALFFCVVALFAAISRRVPALTRGEAFLQPLPHLFRLGALLVATWLGCRAVRQPFVAAGFAPTRAGWRLLIGAGYGALMLAVVCGLPWLLGKSVVIVSPDVPPPLLSAVAALATISALEEVAMRGFLFQQLARVHAWVAVAATGIFFGIGHLGNPNASPTAAAVIALVGVWFGLLRWFTGSVWLPIGLHISWNTCEGFLWGHPVSGMGLGTFFLRRLSFVDRGGWTGGAFGPEASVLTAVCLALAIALTLVWRRRKLSLTVGSGR